MRPTVEGGSECQEEKRPGPRRAALRTESGSECSAFSCLSPLRIYRMFLTFESPDWEDN